MMISSALLEKFVETLVDPDMIGATEYLAVYELVQDCDDLDMAEGACAELIDRATEMLSEIKQFKK